MQLCTTSDPAACVRIAIFTIICHFFLANRVHFKWYFYFIHEIYYLTARSLLHLNFWPHFTLNSPQAITMETIVVHRGNMIWMSMVEVNGFVAIKCASTHKAFIHILYALPKLVRIYVECMIKRL